MQKITYVLVLFLFLSFTAKAQINMGINIQENPDGSVNMDMQMDTPEGSVRTSQSAGMNGVQQNVNIQESSSTGTQIQQEVWNPAAQPRTQQPAPQPRVQPGAPQRCMYAMNPYDFQQAKQSIEKQTFEDSKIQIAKQIAGSNCLSSVQVKEILQLFTFEENKLDLAKALYGVVIDRNNYFLINDVFTYSSSVDELNEFMMGK